jgi:hypothetical protein
LERRQFKAEQTEKNNLSKLVETYEYILNLARQNIRTEEKLKVVEGEIQEKESLIEEMESRKQALEKITKKQLITKSLDHDLSLLLRTYNDIVQLRTEYANLGELPDVPEEKRNDIEKEISVAIKRPYEFPKSFIFKSVLLVLFIFLLPSPINIFITIPLLSVVLKTFFEAIALYQDENLKRWVINFADTIGILSAFSIWLSAFSTLKNTIFDVNPYNQIIRLVMDETSYHLIEEQLLAIPVFITVTGVILSFICAFIHWRTIKNNALSPLQKSFTGA